MVDIHCHILPGIDDGPESIEMSIEMAEMAITEGISHIVATPHASDRFPFVPELVRQRRDEIQALFEGRLQFATGCDFHMSYENLQDIREHPTKYTINQNKYLLVEFADFSLPPSTDQSLHQLHLAGLLPIITHPERNPLVRSHPERLYRWLRQGCYVQVTAQSLLGGFGQTAQRAIERWLDEDCIHFIASDAHNVTSRPLKLREAFDAVAERKGQDVARALFEENPLAAFEGRSLPYVPEPAEDVAAPEGSHVPKRRKRFWIF